MQISKEEFVQKMTELFMQNRDQRVFLKKAFKLINKWKKEGKLKWLSLLESQEGGGEK